MGPKLHPGGGLFGPWPFLILKSSHQDLSNEESKFILSVLKVVHWVAQTQPFLDKLPEITALITCPWKKPSQPNEVWNIIDSRGFSMQLIFPEILCPFARGNW